MQKGILFIQFVLAIFSRRKKYVLIHENILNKYIIFSNQKIEITSYLNIF